VVDLFRYRHWDLVSKRGLYYLISVLMLAIGIIALVMNKAQTGSAMNYGIDFKGGGLVTYQLADNTHFQSDNQRAEVGKQIREALTATGIGNEVQIAPGTGSKNNGDQIIVRTLLGEGAKEKKGQQLEDEILNTITPAANEAAKSRLPTAPVADVMASYAVPAIPDAGKRLDLTRGIQDALKLKEIDAKAKIAPGKDSTGNLLIVRAALGQQFEETVKSKITPTVNAQLKKVVANAPAISTPTSVVPYIIRTESYDVVSGTIKNDLIKSGVAALIIGSLLIMLWIWLRYNIGGLGLRYSFAGILALGHDLLTLVGLFALLRVFLQVNSPFIAALLTVLGYSIHDTIVIFDRIRENLRLRKGRTFAETVNLSLLETMARSVNTILTVLFTLLALFFFGGPTLRDFVAAMLIGVTVGGYSSIFVASQLLVSWSKGRERVILPLDAPVMPAMAGAAPQPTTGGAVSKPAAQPTSAVQTPTASREAIQRAKHAGKTSRRRR